MAVPKRAAFSALGVVALALTVTGVVLAATDQSPSGRTVDPLALNGYPPRSADLKVVVTTSQSVSVTAELAINFVTNAVEANVQVPLLFASDNVDLRLVHHHFYASVANLSSIVGSSWVGTSMASPSLYGLSLEMTKPDLYLISGFTHETVSKSSYSTTYLYHRDNAVINTPRNFPLPLPTRGAVDFSITLGKQGELTATSFTVTTATSRASITATVESYNQSARIVAPPAKEVGPLTAKVLHKLLGSTSLGSLLSPGAVSSLGQVRLT